MSLALTVVIAALAGAVVAWIIGWLLRRRSPSAPRLSLESTAPVVPDGVLQVLGILRSAAVVVGPHDEVLVATSAARTLGIARGSRVGVPELLSMARQARRDDLLTTTDLEIRRGGQGISTFLSVRVAAMDDDLVLILAEDQTAARRIEQTRQDFVANVSHELKTPIGAIALLVEAVEDAADDPTAVRRFASRMGIESARLVDLVAQIIDLSRLQTDDPLVAPEEVEIDEVMADAVDRCRVDADKRDITLTIAGTSGCQVLGNARQLSVAVANLVENAMIYSDPGARVVVAAHVQVRSDDDYIEITVSDTGIGIPPAELERIFERFYRVDYARSRANGGTGLGLAIVKHIVATHSGEISVWSQPGQGSTFSMWFPAHLYGQQTDLPGRHGRKPRQRIAIEDGTLDRANTENGVRGETANEPRESIRR